MTAAFLLSAFCLLLSRSPAFALGIELGVEAAAGAQQIYPMGNASYKGTVLDVKSDLNLGQITAFTGRVRADLPLIIPNIYLMASPMKFEGTQVRSLTFTYGDNTYSANFPYTTTLKLDHYDLTLFYGVPALKTATMGILNVDLGLNVRLIDFKGEIVQPQSGFSQSKSLSIPVPMGYASVQVAPIGLIKIEGEVKAVAYGGSRYIDGVARVKIKPIPFVFISAGYGFQNIKIDQSDVKTDLQFGGPIAELGVEF